MKNVKLLFILLAVVITSCSTADSEDATIQADLTLETATRTAILSELETTVTEETGVLIQYEESKVLEIDGKIYLRAWSGDFVTTTLLGKDKDGKLQSRGVSCSTEACSGSATQCVPENGYCTSCPGDCKRTTSADELAEIAG
ncbi:hypothetical protein ACFO3O_09105 [Dokdonia ponticola]|uniref:Uncharacterized protein n=1 Tax=Dokdonia ponticola TaxID=2041041 RepID=A0ABV9HV79_9FLAO